MKALPHPHLPAFASEGSELRAENLRAYLLDLRGVYTAYAPLPPVTLYVLSEGDWRARLPYPYGLPFQRTEGERLSLFSPARYPERLLHRLRALLLPLGPPPGEIPFFLDLTLGHEYAHAVQVAFRLRTGSRWLDEFLANYLFLLGLQARPDLKEHLLAWSRYLAALNPEERRLSAYERKRGNLKTALWFQAHFALKAEDLLREKGDEPLRRMLEAAPLDRKKGYRLLLEIDPSLRGWFTTFGKA